jgi:hypothetical protein
VGDEKLFLLNRKTFLLNPRLFYVIQKNLQPSTGLSVKITQWIILANEPTGAGLIFASMKRV